MRFEDLWHRWQLVDADFDRAAWCHYTDFYINEVAKHSPAVLRKLNEDARFWNYQRDCLQSGFFMAVGRLFDSASDALTISRLLNLVGEHSDSLLSRTALARRK